MANRKTDKKNSGVPQSYSSTELPTPSKVISKLLSPLSPWILLLIISILTYGVTGVVHKVTGIDFNLYVYSAPVVAFLIGAYLTTRPIETLTRQSVPSIEDVSRTKEYTAVASRISILTMIFGTISMTALLLINIIGWSPVSSVVRFGSFILILFAFVFSYTIVYTLCSYTPMYQKTMTTVPVDISSVPEIVTVVGFIIPPISVFYGAYVYHRPAIVRLPFEVTAIDAFVGSASVLILYIAFVYRI